MPVQYNNNSSISYGFEQGFVVNPPAPIIARRDPTANDGNAAIGTAWINKSTGGVFFLTSIVGNAANWAATAGGGEIVASITATTGPNAITGTTTINTTGAATTTIGTGGTGAVQIGNTTGNTSVTGSLTASTGLTATTGGVTASAGNITATAGSVSAGTTVTAGTGITATTGNVAITTGNLTFGAAAGKIVFQNTIQILSGTGAPAVVAPQGSLYTRTDGSGVNDRLYVNTDGNTTWTAVVTVA